jgi:hypothetical protein
LEAGAVFTTLIQACMLSINTSCLHSAPRTFMYGHDLNAVQPHTVNQPSTPSSTDKNARQAIYWKALSILISAKRKRHNVLWYLKGAAAV